MLVATVAEGTIKTYLKESSFFYVTESTKETLYRASYSNPSSWNGNVVEQLLHTDTEHTIITKLELRLTSKITVTVNNDYGNRKNKITVPENNGKKPYLA